MHQADGINHNLKWFSQNVLSSFNFVPDHFVAFFFLVEFATDKDADVHAITIHGDEEMKRGDYASAFQRYKKAAKLGDSKAQVKVLF